RAQCVHLILHQRDKRRDDDIGATRDCRWSLITKRLATSGRHHHQRIAPLESGPNSLSLQRPQALKSPELPNRGEYLLGYPAVISAGALAKIVERLHFAAD